MAISRMFVLSVQTFDGTPCAVKVACTVWVGGKAGDYIKRLPIGIIDTSDIAAENRLGFSLPGRETVRIGRPVRIDIS